MTSGGAVVPIPAGPSRAGTWLSGYRAMLRWEIVGSRLLYPLLVISQVLVGAGFVIGFGLLIPELDPVAALRLSTGAVVMSLILVGLVVTPQLVAQQKMQGSYDYVWSMPVPRSAAVLASTTLAAAVAVPGVVVGLLVATWRYDVTFSIDLTVIPAFLLTVACGSFIGSAVGHAVERPQRTLLFTQLSIFFVIGFSPISFPVERLPQWLSSIHGYLPVHHMALAVNSSLTRVEPEPTTWLVLIIWTVASASVTALALMRRR